MEKSAGGTVFKGESAAATLPNNTASSPWLYQVTEESRGFPFHQVVDGYDHFAGHEPLR
jgi:hypothetical protein